MASGGFFWVPISIKQIGATFGAGQGIVNRLRHACRLAAGSLAVGGLGGGGGAEVEVWVQTAVRAYPVTDWVAPLIAST